MCGSKLLCACGTHLGSNLRCVCMRYILRLVKCDRKKYFFGKLLGRYWDLKQWLKAKILNQVLLYKKVAVARCDHQKSKLRAVAVADGFWVKKLRVWQVMLWSKVCTIIFLQWLFCRFHVLIKQVMMLKISKSRRAIAPLPTPLIPQALIRKGRPLRDHHMRREMGSYHFSLVLF